MSSTLDHPRRFLARWSGRRLAITAIVAAVGLELATAAVLYGAESLRLTFNSGRTVSLPGRMMAIHHAYLAYDGPAIDTPRTSTAGAAKIGDHETVFGVTVGGKYRAYRTAAMLAPSTHIVNDVINGVPVSVTYCSVSHCVRAFTGDQAGKPLAIRVAGLFMGGMYIQVDGNTYEQKTLQATQSKQTAKKFPFAVYPVETLPWKEWREQHPDSDVYEGEDAAAIMKSQAPMTPLIL